MRKRKKHVNSLDRDLLADRFIICDKNDILEKLMQSLKGKGLHRARSRNWRHYLFKEAFIEK
jgi:hypothetical protein